MKLVVFGLAVSSSWGNGHATLWRGLIASLTAWGHRVVFFERNLPFYAPHRDLSELPPGGELVLYPCWEDVLPRARRELAEADVALVTSCCPDGVAACRLVLDSRAAVKCFEVVVGLPDTVWFPEDGLARLPGGGLAFLLFPVETPELFDAVVTEGTGEVRAVREIQVKRQGASSSWVWGAFRLGGAVLRELHAPWLTREPRDPYLGTRVNAWLARGGSASAVLAGEAYMDVGTRHGYREAVQQLSGSEAV